MIHHFISVDEKWTQDSTQHTSSENCRATTNQHLDEMRLIHMCDLMRRLNVLSFLMINYCVFHCFSLHCNYFLTLASTWSTCIFRYTCPSKRISCQSNAVEDLWTHHWCCQQSGKLRRSRQNCKAMRKLWPLGIECVENALRMPAAVSGRVLYQFL